MKEILCSMLAAIDLVLVTGGWKKKRVTMEDESVHTQFTFLSDCQDCVMMMRPSTPR